MKEAMWLREEKYNGVASLAYEADLKRLAAGEPLAYVIGWQPFLALKIYLDSHPLIPRPETEWWVEQLLKNVSAPARLTFLDLCAGSGAIGCAALARLPNAKVYFGEIDPAHRATIVRNIRENKLDESRALSKIGNLFEPFGAMQFDVIAVNPPYIPVDRTLDRSVTDHEPSLALRSGSDGLDLIRRIALEIPRHLSPSGIAYIEIDSSHADTARSLFEAAGLSAAIRTDQYSVPRILIVSFPNARAAITALCPSDGDA